MTSHTICRAAALAAALLLVAASPSGAQTCGQDYVVQDGDSLAKIASKAYGKSSDWTIIFYANQDRLGGGQTLLVPGLSIRIPCPSTPNAPKLPDVATTEAQAPQAPAPIATSAEVKKVQFLTADDYAPFTDRSLENGGMATDIVTSAMALLKKETNSTFDYNVSWVNDWSAHLNPLLVTRAFDMGFPWYKPDCASFADLDTDAKYRCQKFFFSNPIFEEQVLLFVGKDSPLKLDSDAEIPGHTLCRPSGYWTFDLDSGGRNWVKGNKITLMRPQSVDECFRLLTDGKVDGVALNELTGRAALVRLDLNQKVRVIDKPLAILSLHVIVAKTHPNARTLLYYVNTALDKLRAAGTYDQIVEKHLQAFWDSQTEQKPAAKTSEDKPADTSATDSATAAAAAATATAAAAAATTEPAKQ